VGASLVSPGIQLLKITNKMSLLSSSHSTLIFTIQLLINLSQSDANIIEALSLVIMDCQTIKNPIIRRVMVAGHILIVIITISLMTKMGFTHLQVLRGQNLHCLNWKSMSLSYNEMTEPSSSINNSSNRLRQIEKVKLRLYSLTIHDFPNNIIKLMLFLVTSHLIE
jgi:hypothetical protein